MSGFNESDGRETIANNVTFRRKEEKYNKPAKSSKKKKRIQASLNLNNYSMYEISLAYKVLRALKNHKQKRKAF